MKITAEDYARLECAVLNALNGFTEDRIREHRNNVPFVEDQFTSFCWDVMAQVDRLDGFELNNDLHSYLKDSHISTALKAILQRFK